MAEALYDAAHQEIGLTTEQQACLKYTGDKTLMVKGFAGSGKSLVLMALAQKYMQKYSGQETNKVGIFTFQNTLVSTTREFLNVQEGNTTGIYVDTVNHYLSTIYKELICRKQAPSRHYLGTSKSDQQKRQRLVESALKAHKAKNGKHRFQEFPVDFWIDEFNWMKDMNIGKDDLQAYVQYKRKGRGNKYRFSSTDYQNAFQIYKFYLEQQEKQGLADWADQPMFLVRNKDLIPDEMKFDHILIDEAQDLSLAQMTALMLLYRDGGDMMVAMDANQKIYGKYWTPKLLGIEATTKKLTKSMRTTKQIDALAESVRSKNNVFLDDDDISLRAIPEKDGSLPKLVHLDKPEAEQKYVVERIKSYLQANPNMTIGIIASSNKQIDEYSGWLTDANIPHEQVRKDSTFSMVKPGVKVVSAHSAKGLEFNVVIIPKFLEGHFPYSYQPEDEEDWRLFIVKMRNLVYVSMTRAKNILMITWAGHKGSRFIAEMDEACYENEGTPFKISVPEVVYDKPVIQTKPAEAKATELEPKQVQKQASKPLSITTETTKTETPESLAEFLKAKGLEVYDKRDRKGALWVVGGKELDPILKETRKLFGAMWTFSQKGGRTTANRPGWFTSCKK